MSKAWAVIRREFVERVRSKWFLISTILGPLFMIGVTVLPSLLMMKSGGTSDITIVNAGAGPLGSRIRSQLSRGGGFRIQMDSVSEDAQAKAVDSLTLLVQENALDGFLVLNSATLESGSAEYRGRNVSSLREMEALNQGLRQGVIVERLTRLGVNPTVVQEAQKKIDLRTLRISRRGATGESGMSTFFLGYGVGLVLYMIILIYGINVMRGVIEEKQTRIIELLVSSMKPFQLMLGKVVGIGGVGLFQFSIWGLTGYLMIHYRAAILGAFHVPTEAINQVQLPTIGGELVFGIIAYFLLGYLLYSALFAVVGASVNSEAEAQQAQQPVMMLLVFSLIISFSALSDSGGRLAYVTSLIPFSAPIIMPVRMATGDVPLNQLVLSLAISLVSVVLIVWVSARIYRIGILMYGKRPNIKELFRWARQS